MAHIKKIIICKQDHHYDYKKKLFWVVDLNPSYALHSSRKFS